jgi:peptidylprolyl isomerase
MSKVSRGDLVQVHYTGKLTGGGEFDSSREGDPLTVKIGAGQLIKGFEKGLLGMAIGERKTIVIPPEEAYGSRHEQMVRVVSLDQLPAGLKIEKGMVLESSDKQGRPVEVRVTQVDDQRAVLDMNHPLAGETLTFDLEIMAITPKGDE